MKITAIDTCILTIPMQREMKKQFAHHKLVVVEAVVVELFIYIMVEI